MKIGIDAGGLGITDERLKVGVYHIVKDVLIELSRIDTKNTYLLYSFYPIHKEIIGKLGSNMHNVVVKPKRGWMKIWLPLRLLMDNVDIFVGANQALPLQLPFTKKYKKISIFYDIAFEVLPELYAYAGDLSKLKNNSKYAVANSDVIISISEKTKEDLNAIYGTSLSKIEVAYPPITVGKPEEKSQFDKEYFLFVGAFKKSKNVPLIISSFGEFMKKSKKEYYLVLVGGDRWLDPAITKAIENLSQRVQSLIKIIPATAQKGQLATLYSHALAFVSPSIYEGFGLPLIEAMMLGCPVISSFEGSIPEVLGKAGILVPATSQKQLTEAMSTIAINMKNREELKDRAKENVKRFKKDAIAKTIYSIISSYEKDSHS